MIPVDPRPEPEQFSELVEKPGERFLQRVPNPTPKQWDSHAYWQRVLMQARKKYRGICAYSAHWIPSDTGVHTIDHFIPKTSEPSLAYRWDNYRYTSLRFNSRKGTKKILDPFRLEPHWFVIQFPSLRVQPGAGLSGKDEEAVRHTIEVLKLNDEETGIDARMSWVTAYCRKDITFKHLKNRAPFIAVELKRQGLTRRMLARMMKFVK